MSQQFLFAPKAPPVADLVDLRNCDVAELLPMKGDLCIADPPWSYVQKIGESRATNHYKTLPMSQIVEHLAEIDCPRMVVWLTWPIMAADWPERLPNWGRPVTGGAWTKSSQRDSGHYGQGYHWAGCSEPLLVYTRSGGHNSRELLRNAWIDGRKCDHGAAWVEPPGKHSVKPIDWMVQMVRRWCPAGGRVVDPYAGLGSVAEAVLRAGDGRSYLGAEVDAKRHGDALGILAQVRL